MATVPLRYTISAQDRGISGQAMGLYCLFVQCTIWTVALAWLFMLVQEHGKHNMGTS